MIFAISAAPAAIPVKPKIAAISAITKNVIVQRNINLHFSYTPSITNSMPRGNRDIPRFHQTVMEKCNTGV